MKKLKQIFSMSCMYILRPLTKFFLFCCVVASFSSQAQIIATIGFGDIASKASSTDSVSGTLSDELYSVLASTRKFRVLQKAEVEKKLARRNLDLEGFYSKNYVSTELEQTGLDYILKADISNYGVVTVTKNGLSQRVAKVGVEYVLLGVADSTDDFAFKAVVETPLAQLSSDNSQALAAGLEEVVEVLVRQVTAELLPIRLMKIDEDGLVTLNYGSALLNVGDAITVYGDEQTLALDETGSPKGVSLGRLRIVEANTKFSIGQIVDGFTKIEKGQVGLIHSAKP